MGIDPGPARLASDERREALLDVAVAIATRGSIDEVTMESIAQQAGVSRPLVYKHFANRAELLAALYRREAENLHGLLAKRVSQARSLEEMFDALISGSLAASAERGALFSALRSAGGWTREVRRAQRARDTTTAKAFAAVARREGLDPERAGPATIMLLSLVDSVVAQLRADPSIERARLLHDTYMVIVRSTLDALRG